MPVMDIERAKNKYEGKLLRFVRSGNSPHTLRLWLNDGPPYNGMLENAERICDGEIVLALSIYEKDTVWKMECVTPNGIRSFVTFASFMWEVVEES